MDVAKFLLAVRENRWAGISSAAILVAGAIILRFTTPTTLTYVTFYPAVILATVAGGRLVGFGAMLVSTLAAIYFFLPPVGSLAVTTSDIWNASAFWAVCSLIIFLTDQLVVLIRTEREKSAKLQASESQQQVLMRELSHRMKNQYSVIVAMARASGGSSSSIAEFQSKFAERLQSMSRAHDLLTRSGWEPVAMTDLIGTELEPFLAPGRANISGPDVRLKEQAVVNFGMALHELATNSAKHGAWSAPGGKVSLSWELKDGTLTFTWQEHGGHAASESEKAGFGTLLLQKIIPTSLQGTAQQDYSPNGFSWTLRVPASCVEKGSGFRALKVSPNQNGAPDRIRTCDLCLRRAALYPAELRVQRVEEL